MPPENPEHKFPLLQILSMLFASILVTSLLLWAWHVMTLRTLTHSLNARNDDVRTEIVSLTKIRDELKLGVK